MVLPAGGRRHLLDGPCRRKDRRLKSGANSARVQKPVDQMALVELRTGNLSMPSLMQGPWFLGRLHMAKVMENGRVTGVEGMDIMYEKITVGSHVIRLASNEVIL